MDCTTPWVLAIAPHTGLTLVIMTMAMATTITGMCSELVLLTGTAGMTDTEAEGDDAVIMTEAMMAVEEAGGVAVIAER